MEGQRLEMWGGIEATVNRVGDRYFDQVARNGHDRPLEDIDLIAALGVRRVRYPVLWERVAPAGIEHADWRWTDERLSRLRDLGVQPIAGLLHHGSGPRDTSLLDPAFPRKLADYARAVARRYPWVRYWTPVNEPLTTARFSALYGHWYPHSRGDRSFITALVQQCRGIAMQSIRDVIPEAELVLTEDLGKTHSTPVLRPQTHFENERRWLSFDLLCRAAEIGHPFLAGGLLQGFERDIEWFGEHPARPAILGINHYLTSERFLDEKMERYPAWSHGGSGHQRYADVEAVRVRGIACAGFEGLLRETWDRYRLPLAVTECHLGCSREEQLRWLLDTWDAAERLRAEGADMRAVTVWSLFGSYDWHCLVTREEGHYEPGVFDCRGGTPRPTAIARAVAALARGERPAHPALRAPGWWRRPDRFFYDPAPEVSEAAS